LTFCARSPKTRKIWLTACSKTRAAWLEIFQWSLDRWSRRISWCRRFLLRVFRAFSSSETDRESIERSDLLAGQSDKSVRSSVAKPKIKNLPSSLLFLFFLPFTSTFYNLYMYLLEPLTPAQVQNTVQLYPALLAHNKSSTLPLFQA